VIRISMVAGFTVALLATTSLAQAAVQTGILECRTGPRIGLVIGSHVKMSCVFKPNVGPAQRYAATEGRIGLDLGITAGGALAWAVFAPSNAIAPGALGGGRGNLPSNVSA
jgi:hypothetical protein